MSKQPTGGERPSRPEAARNASPSRVQVAQIEMDFVRFKGDVAPLDFAVDLASDTIWATPEQIATLFGVDVAAVEREVAAVFASGELADDAHGRAPAVGDRDPEGNPAKVGHSFDLDVILSIGYRLDAPKAARFRRWATRLLRNLVLDGYALDEARLHQDREGANALAGKLRAIRADERNVYESVREFFAAAAGDFDERSEACAAFAAMLQNKFIFAATGETPSDLILERADHDAPDMGLRTHSGDVPTIAEAKIATNYLDADELFILHSLCELFLLTIEAKARRKEPMTMRDLGAKLDALLRLEDYPVLAGRKDFHKDRAIRHAQAEYARFIMRAGKDRAALG